MQAKTTRAFRTISEAGDELGLQPHVLRFWESKFPDIKPIKRGGGRRFYRPEDIEFLRGIKILLHDEKHPIKDVQKLIRVKGAGSVVELGQSKERASVEKKVAETVLIPDRIQKAKPPKRPIQFRPIEEEPVVAETEPAPIEIAEPVLVLEEEANEDVIELTEVVTQEEITPAQNIDRESLEDALKRLTSLRSSWAEFKKSTT